MTTEQMDNDYFYKVLDEKISNINTRNNYKTRLTSLLNKVDIEHKHEVLYLLAHPRKYFPLVEERYNHKISTVKNVLTFILSLFKYASLKCKFERSYNKWKEFHEEYSNKEQEIYDNNVPSESQQAKYISFKEMREKIQTIKSPHATLRASLEYCLMNMYLEIIPKRADFGQIRVYSKDKQKTDRNYLVLGDNESYFVLNHYNKTQKDEPIIEPVNDRLASIFKASMKQYPRKYLYVGIDGEAFRSANSYAKFVVGTYKKYFKKPIGVSMLRHIYISDKVDFNKLSVKEKDHIASSMAHSRKQQEQYKLFFNDERKTENEKKDNK